MVTAVIGNDALSRILNSLSLQHNRYNDSKELYEPSISDILSIFKEEQYILWYPRRTQILIALKEGITPVQQLKAWAHALLLAKAWLEWVLSFPERLGNGDSLHAEAELMEIIASTLEQVNRDWKVIEEGLRRNGWDVDTASLETGEGTRVKVDI